MKTRIMKCAICNKKFVVKEWKSRKGVLKGSTIISDVFCSNKCRKRFKLLIKLNDVLEEIDEVR